MGRIPDMQGALIMMMVIAALGGWAVIEFVLWLFSFIHITLG